MLAWTQNESQHVLTNIPCQRGHIMYLNLCWPKPTHYTEDRKWIGISVDVSFPCQRAHEMILKMCWPNLSHASEDTKYNWTCVEQTYPMPGGSQNNSYVVLTRPFPCQQRHKMYLNMSCLNSSHAVGTKNLSTLIKHLCLQKPKTYVN